MNSDPYPAGIDVVSDPRFPSVPNRTPGIPTLNPMPPLLFAGVVGYKTPNGEPMNWQYIHDHHRSSPIPNWWREVTAILNNKIVHAEVKRDPTFVPKQGELEPLLLTGRYYWLGGLREIPLL